MINKFLIILSVCTMMLSSCVSPRQTNYLQNIKKDYPEATNLINSDYRIIPGDQLGLKIYTLDESMKELFSTYVKTTSTGIEGASTAYNGGAQPNVLNVYSDGTIKIPYIGKVYVQDLTVLEAKKLIEERFLTFSPNLTIEVTLKNRYFSVLGEAGQARIEMPTLKINIFQALALAGPIGTFGDRTNVKIVRQTPNGTEVKVFDIRSKDIVDSEYYYIEPNDVIYVSRMNRTFFGSVTSFTGMLGLFSIVTTVVGVAVYLISLTK